MIDKKLKVLQIVPRLDLGGVERGVADFSSYLVEKGHKSVVVSDGGRLVKELQEHGAVYYQLPVHKKSLFTALGCIKKVRAIILKEKIDVVHGRSRVPDWIGFFASLKTPAQFVTTAHGYYSVHFFSKIVALGRIVISASKAIARHLVDNFKISPSKIRVISRGVRIEEFNFVRPEGKDFSEVRLCFLGRISPTKGVEYFIEAVNCLYGSVPNVKAFIAGSASKKHREYEQLLRKKVKWYGLSDVIQFLGRVDASGVLEKSHFIIIPSVGIPEPFGRVAIEAQAKGTVCIATDSGGLSEIIRNGETGFLVPEYDYKAIADRVQRLIKNKMLYNQMVYNGRSVVEEKYTSECMSSQVCEVYNEVLGHKNILVVKLSSLGDVVVGTASIRSIRKKFPNAYLAVLCNRSYFKIVKDSCDVNEVIVREEKTGYINEVFRLSKVLRRRNFDIVVDIQNNHFSQLVSFLSFPKKVIGFKRKFSFFLDVKIDYPDPDVGPLESQLKLLEPLGVENISYPCLAVDSLSLDNLRDKFIKGCDENQLLVGMNIRASAGWQTKNLKRNSLNALIKYLVSSKKAKVILTGEEGLFDYAEKIRKIHPQNVINLCGKTNVRELIALISLVDIFVTPDSAPLHIAASLGTGTIGIFGPTDPRRHLVYKDNVYVIRRKDLSCLSCYKKKCIHNKCMDIKLDKFKELIDKVLK